MKLVQQHAMLQKLRQDGRFAVGGIPLGQKAIERGIDLADVLAAKGSERLGHQVAVAVVVLHPLGHDVDFNAVYIQLVAAFALMVLAAWRCSGVIPIYRWVGWHVRRHDGILVTRLIDLHWLPIKQRVEEQTRGVAKVEDG